MKGYSNSILLLLFPRLGFGFSPLPATSCSSSRLQLSLKASKEERSTNKESIQVATLAASFILASSIAVVQLPQVAFAASAAKPAAAVKSQAANTNQPAATAPNSVSVISDPFFALNADVTNARRNLATTAATLDGAKKLVLEAKANEAKALDNLSLAEKNVKTAKQALIAVNDKLADAKTKELEGGATAIKQVELLAKKVGSFYFIS